MLWIHPHHVDAVPDADPDPTYHFDADPNPEFYLMRMRIRIRVLHDVDSGPDPAFFADPDRAQGVI